MKHPRKSPWNIHEKAHETSTKKPMERSRKSPWNVHEKAHETSTKKPMKRPRKSPWNVHEKAHETFTKKCQWQKLACLFGSAPKNHTGLFRRLSTVDASIFPLVNVSYICLMNAVFTRKRSRGKSVLSCWKKHWKVYSHTWWELGRLDQIHKFLFQGVPKVDGRRWRCRYGPISGGIRRVPEDGIVETAGSCRHTPAEDCDQSRKQRARALCWGRHLRRISIEKILWMLSIIKTESYFVQLKNRIMKNLQNCQQVCPHPVQRTWLWRSRMPAYLYHGCCTGESRTIGEQNVCFEFLLSPCSPVQTRPRHSGDTAGRWFGAPYHVFGQNNSFRISCRTNIHMYLVKMTCFMGPSDKTSKRRFYTAENGTIVYNIILMWIFVARVLLEYYMCKSLLSGSNLRTKQSYNASMQRFEKLFDGKKEFWHCRKNLSDVLQTYTVLRSHKNFIPN